MCVKCVPRDSCILDRKHTWVFACRTSACTQLTLEERERDDVVQHGGMSLGQTVDRVSGLPGPVVVDRLLSHVFVQVVEKGAVSNPVL